MKQRKASKKCPKCGSPDVKQMKFEDGEQCQKCHHRFLRCPECGSCNIEPVMPFDYVKECKNCFHQFFGDHN